MRFLYDFSSASLFTFLGGILAALAGNFLTTARLTTTESLSMDVGNIYAIAGCLFVSMAGCILISCVQENARRDWEMNSAQQLVLRSEFLRKPPRKYLLILGFLLFVVGLLGAGWYSCASPPSPPHKS
jgi:hypothetical protein